MFTLNDRLRARDEEVAAKVIDGEAILINLSNGIYYSLDKVGGLIWGMVEERNTIGDIVMAVVGCYDVSREQAEADVLRLVDELFNEDLVALAEDAAASPSNRTQVEGEGLDYDCPKLNVYRDMGDLLALDPPMPGLQDIAWIDPDAK